MEPLYYQESGSGPLLLLLHGFPDIGLVWQSQLRDLSSSFQVLVPDLRGYGSSPRPSGVECYRAQHLIQDVINLIDGRPCFLAGHDWGGAIAWMVAAKRPDLVRKLAILNCPHPDALRRQLVTNPRQLWRSKYMLFFQLPWLPEQLILRNTRRWIRSRHSGSQAYLDQVVESLSSPGGASAALNYYRAALRSRSPALPDIEVPTSLIWGLRDRAMGVSLALASQKYVKAAFSMHLWPDAGHWVQLDQPDRTSRTLRQFLT